MDTSKDSRRDPRAKILSLTVRYKSATVAEFLENHSYDVSRGGLFIRTPAPFPSGTLIKFEVRIAEEQQVLTGVGRVAWRRERDRGEDAPAGMGVKFIKIDEESVGVIDRLVSSRPQGDSSFEAGAQEQGIPLSDPPAELRNGKEDRISSRPPPASEMLDQSSALLKSAIDSISSSRLSGFEREEERVTLPTGQDLARAARAAEATQLAAGAGEAPAEPSVSQASDVEPAADASAETGAGAGVTTPASARSKPEAVTPASGEERRGKGKKRPKKEKKRKKKFRYASIPNPKQPLSQAVAPNAVPLSLPSVTTTPPRKRKTEAPPPTAPNNTVWFVLATVVVLLGLYWINRSEDTSPEPRESEAAADARSALEGSSSAGTVSSASVPPTPPSTPGPNVVPLPSPVLSADVLPAPADATLPQPVATSPVVNLEDTAATSRESGRRVKERPKRDERSQESEPRPVQVIPVTPTASRQEPEPQPPPKSEAVAPQPSRSPGSAAAPTPAAPGNEPTSAPDAPRKVAPQVATPSASVAAPPAAPSAAAPPTPAPPVVRPVPQPSPDQPRTPPP